MSLTVPHPNLNYSIVPFLRWCISGMQSSRHNRIHACRCLGIKKTEKAIVRHFSGIRPCDVTKEKYSFVDGLIQTSWIQVCKINVVTFLKKFLKSALETKCVLEIWVGLLLFELYIFQSDYIMTKLQNALVRFILMCIHSGTKSVALHLHIA